VTSAMRSSTRLNFRAGSGAVAIDRPTFEGRCQFDLGPCPLAFRWGSRHSFLNGRTLRKSRRRSNALTRSDKTTFEVVCMKLGNAVSEREGDKDKLNDLYATVIKSMVGHANGRLEISAGRQHDGPHRTASDLELRARRRPVEGYGVARRPRATRSTFACITRPRRAWPLPTRRLSSSSRRVRPLAKAPKEDVAGGPEARSSARREAGRRR